MATKRKTARAAEPAPSHEGTPNAFTREEWRVPDPELTHEAADRRILAELRAAKGLPASIDRWRALAELKYLVTESLVDEAVAAAVHGQSLLEVEWIVAFLAATDEVINETRSKALEQPDVRKPLVSLRSALVALQAAIDGDVMAPAPSPGVLQSLTWAASAAVLKLQFAAPTPAAARPAAELKATPPTQVLATKRGATDSEHLLDEGVMSILDAAAAEGLDICSATALRWATAGVRGARLESIRVGHRRLTSRAAIRRFVAAQQHDNDPPVAPTRERAGAGMQPLSPEAARRVLQRHGLAKE